MADLETSDLSKVLPSSNLLSLEQIQEQLKRHQDELFQRKLDLHVSGPKSDDSSLNNDYLLQHQYNDNQVYVSSNTWSFTQGLIVGQLSVVFVIIIFIKFFVFAESSPALAKSSIGKDASVVIVKRDKKDQSSSDDVDPDANSETTASNAKVAAILEKTYYDVDNHSPESLDWFNVLVAQTIAQLRSEALLSDNIYHSLNHFLLMSELPEYLDKIKLTEIDIGDDFPIFSNCRIKHGKDGSGRLEAKIDVDLSDTLTLGIETKLLLNHPRPLTAILPVQLSVSMVRFTGCLTVSLINTADPEFAELSAHNSSELGEAMSRSHSTGSPEGDSSHDEAISTPDSTGHAAQKKHSKDDPNHGTALMFSFSPDYRLEFTVKSFIGARAKLQDVPKISSLIENRLRAWFIERCIEPRFQVVRLPSLWPRRKNTREQVANKNGDKVDDSSN